jgi:hypothetical protein
MPSGRIRSGEYCHRSIIHFCREPEGLYVVNPGSQITNLAISS